LRPPDELEHRPDDLGVDRFGEPLEAVAVDDGHGTALDGGGPTPADARLVGEEHRHGARRRGHRLQRARRTPATKARQSLS
jgi:hypothetical protein